MNHDAVTATRRFGLGPRPGELATAASDARGWLLGQLHAPYHPPPELAGLAGAAEVLGEFLQARTLRRERRRDPGGDAGDDPVAVVVEGLRRSVLPH
ncbi:MAG: hypothetical protein MUF07_00880 [Steroidobacteraceae bacterium]|jgi:uncharacterized protein (DUF1800 family)|nr:hypothetical protein [Steroidobacteraceae bacterium]